MKQIEIFVGPDGRTSLETKGFAGAECREASRLLEEALGERQSEQLTSEFYHTRQHCRQENRHST